LKQIRKATSSDSLNSENFNEQTNNQLKRTRSDDEDDVDESIKQEYQSIALQLLDLMRTLHIRASQIYKQIPSDQIISSVLWYKCWCPILQG